jgi:hypothetical protein
MVAVSDKTVIITVAANAYAVTQGNAHREQGMTPPGRATTARPAEG